MTIAVVIPTIRYDTTYQNFLEKWNDLFYTYKVDLVTVEDGDTQVLHRKAYANGLDETIDIDGLLGKSRDLTVKKSPACRNIGFAYVAKCIPNADIIITLDDDLEPLGDTIGDHINALDMHVNPYYFNTFIGPHYPRGYPFERRYSTEVLLSHGVWVGVADWDAPTQLVLGNPSVRFYTGVVPHGVGFSICGMNLGFKRQLLPKMYYAPVVHLPGAGRFDDIWMGLFVKRYLDSKGYAMVTGFAGAKHERASNVYKNLVEEAVGIGINEAFWSHQDEPFFKKYTKMREDWEKWIGQE